MARNRTSAKAAGSRFEREIAEALAQALEDDQIERRARSGAKEVACSECGQSCWLKHPEKAGKVCRRCVALRGSRKSATLPRPSDEARFNSKWRYTTPGTAKRLCRTCRRNRVREYQQRQRSHGAA